MNQTRVLRFILHPRLARNAAATAMDVVGPGFAMQWDEPALPSTIHKAHAARFPVEPARTAGHCLLAWSIYRWFPAGLLHPREYWRPAPSQTVPIDVFERI